LNILSRLHRACRSKQQAVALRRLASRTDLPNQLDLPNIVWEIEDLGDNHLDPVSSLIRLVLSHALLAAADLDAGSVPHWTGEAVTFHADLMQRYQRSMRQRIDMDLLWRRAVRETHGKLQAYQRDYSAIVVARVIAEVVSHCPFSVEEICDDDFEFRAAVGRLRQRLAVLTPS
jgi:hypothetical protein